MPCEHCGTTLKSRRARYCSSACRQAAYRSRHRGEQEGTVEQELKAVRAQLEARPREQWTTDDRNALMALALYFGPGSFRGDRTVLQNCSAPAVQDVVIADEMRAIEA